MLSKIPKTLKVGLVKNLKGGDNNYIKYSNEGKKMFLINPVPKKEANTNKLRSIFFYHYDHKYAWDEMTFVEIPNSGFKLKINYLSYGWRCYTPMPSIEIYHDSFKELSYQPYINIPYRQLMDILTSCGGKLNPNGEFPGTFKIKVGTTGHYPCYDFVKEDNYSHLDQLSIKYGELLETSRRTRDWIPGNIYVLSDREVVLYLGKAKNIKTKQRYYNYSNDITKLFSSSSISDLLGSNDTAYYSKNNALVIRLFSYYNDDLSSFLNPDLSTVITMEKFITEYINSILVTDNFEIGFIKLGENNKLPKAVNLGKLVNFSQDFHKDDITEDLIHELNYKMSCGKLNFNEKTKYMYYSDWFCSRISVTGKLKTLVLKEFIKSYKYLLDYHTSRQLTVDASTIDKIIESILNYRKGDSTDWKDSSLAIFALNLKNILTGTTVYGEVNKDEIKKLILEEYGK